MITKVKTIKNLAVFSDFDWHSTVKDKGNNVAKFKKLNIIYGRNYSGKTSLSRIFRAFKKGEISNKYKNATFELEHVGNEVMNHTNLNSPYVVRVYNKDFVDENLRWLVDEASGIKPFAVLGEKNIEVEKKIEAKEKMLGSEDTKSGLRYDLAQQKRELQAAESATKNASNALDEKLKNKANNDIKRNTTYNVVTYNITSIKSDISALQAKPRSFLSQENIDEKRTLLQEQVKPEVGSQVAIKLKLADLHKAARDLVEKIIKPTESIQELLNDSLIQEWVRHGIGLHKNARSSCAFCGGALPRELWDKLDNHFSKESESLRGSIDALIYCIEEEKLEVKRWFSLERERFYSPFQQRFDLSKKKWGVSLKAYLTCLDSIIVELNARMKNIFETRTMPDIDDIPADIREIEKELKLLVEENNNKSKTLSSDQKTAREDLRLDDVGKFINTIGLKKEEEKIALLASKETKIREQVTALTQSVAQVIGEVAQLKSQLKDERKGAEKVNEYLGHHFGHDGLKLVAVEGPQGSGFSFEIKRGDAQAHNLSEGECSLVAFCYFMAKLEDIDTKGKDTIIWIDDPMCSLDSNHVFFIYSLIESVLMKPVTKPDGSIGSRYSQLFVSTHNLDFLKYLKRLSCAKKDTAYFLLERGQSGSKLRLMPSYLQNYITEFNYLFHQIYKCANDTDTTHDCFYNFGNNMRKFLEAYLFYKYPANKDNTIKLKAFFKDDQLAVDLANRLDNEFSHLEEIFDRSIKPIDIPEIQSLAKYVLNRIQEKDKDQYDALVESISEQIAA